MSPSSSANSLHSFTSNWAEQVKHAAAQFSSKAAGQGGVIKRKALSLKHDRVNGSKYISGLTEVRVWSAEEAKSLLRKGQVNRTVFSTFANRTSSRSHGVFTIRVLRVPKGVQSDDALLSYTTSARLSIVDLAGSERTRNTHTDGERLKEAGNINKSLMVLGQCMQTLRSNQDLLSKHRKPAVVPFRHSKLTELMQSFFEGERGGRAVMIVNVNPCDTGFDENSHVMKFSAVASEVVTVKEKERERERGPTVEVLAREAEEMEKRRREKAVEAARAAGLPEEDSFVVEDEEEEEDDVEDDDDGFVDHLLDELAAMRVKLVEAEIRAAMIESEVREQVMEEMNLRMIDMEESFINRLNEEAEQADLKTDRKIDILNRANQNAEMSEDEEDEDSEEEDGDEDEDEDEVETMLLGDNEDVDLSPPPSPTPATNAKLLAPHLTDVADVSANSTFESATSEADDSELPGLPETIEVTVKSADGTTLASAEVPLSESGPVDEEEEAEEEEEEEDDVDNSLVLKPGSSKPEAKPKRQLRKTKTTDVDALDAITSSFGAAPGDSKKRTSTRTLRAAK